MKAIVVTNQAAGTAGMTLVERPEPRAAINDVVVQVHASGFTWDELTWPSTWTDRLGRDRTPVIPGQEGGAAIIIARWKWATAPAPVPPGGQPRRSTTPGSVAGGRSGRRR